VTKVAPGVAWFRAVFVNLYFVGEPGGPWAVVDTGLPGCFEKIYAAAEARFGRGARPEAIYLTHGHFDHAGSALALSAYWDTPVYAHRLDLPYLTGRSLFPPTDPTPGGALAFLARFFPPNGTDLGDRVRELPAPGHDVPGLAGWEWHATPGHSPGHVSFFRPADRALLAGDACATVDLDSWTALATQKPEISRPPVPVTCDWVAARRSLERLADLEPVTLACGHGTPMTGPEVAGALRALAEDFQAPRHGRYVAEPARTDEKGVVELPPPVPDPLPRTLAGVGIAAALAGVVLAAARKGNRT
jgi:glyoxylase-like metal-dependent hydrolase (beta-lactamase superfamily II)